MLTFNIAACKLIFEATFKFSCIQAVKAVLCYWLHKEKIINLNLALPYSKKNLLCVLFENHFNQNLFSLSEYEKIFSLIYFGATQIFIKLNVIIESDVKHILCIQ